jgi:hypothetical protein
LVRDHLGVASHIVILDWHTGIGSYGEPFFISADPSGSERFDLAGKWWGKERIHGTDLFPDIASPEYSGLVTKALQDEISTGKDTKVLAVVIEWGTHRIQDMLESLLIDRWLRYSGIDPKSDAACDIRSLMIERFYPRDPKWRRSVLEESREIYGQTLQAIIRW